MAYDGAGLWTSGATSSSGSRAGTAGGANPVHAGALLTLAAAWRRRRPDATRRPRDARVSENERWTATDHADAEHDLQYEGNYGAFPATTEDADAPQRQTQFDNDAKYYTAWYGRTGGGRRPRTSGTASTTRPTGR